VSREPERVWEPLLTLAEFKRRASLKFNISLLDDIEAHGPRGEVVIWHFVRTMPDGRLLSARVPTDVDDDEPLSAHTLDRLCRQLQVPRFCFGLFP